MTTARELADRILARSIEDINLDRDMVDLKEWIESLIESAFTEAERRCVNEHANAERLIAWIKTPERERKPANIAFTEGPDRQVAYHIESALEEALVKRDLEQFGESFMLGGKRISPKAIYKSIADYVKEAKAEAYEDCRRIAEACPDCYRCAKEIRSRSESVSGSSADAAGGGKEKA